MFRTPEVEVLFEIPITSTSLFRSATLKQAEKQTDTPAGKSLTLSPGHPLGLGTDEVIIAELPQFGNLIV
jgi:hypothetical protein